MTHDELLAILSSTNRWLGRSEDNAALHAVVELHKPDVLGECDICYQRDTSRYDYPCPTIQAIEKELG